MEQQLDDEISLKELIEKGRELFNYLINKWLVIFLAGIIGGLSGFYFAWSKPVKYTAKISFVAEEGRSSASGLASLAGQFGFDVGGSSGGGIFAGENLLIFLKSEGLIRETLLTPMDSVSNFTLADRYAEINEFKKGWSENKLIGNVDFSKFANGDFPRKEDSLLQVLVGAINKELSVTRPEKKATFVEVKTSTRNELLSKLFTERLVQKGTERYVQSKIKIKAANVALLQKRADSLGALLNRNTYSAAAAQQSLVDINPALRTAPVSAEITSREKMMIATIFAEVVKNLELAKFTLQQETPVIQVVDRSYLPLQKEKESKLKGLLLGGILAGFLTVGFLLARRWWKSILSN
ncbi:MAG: hypothetical protein RLZ05_1076 [Bacteroidota bacterium]|jgi:hypothetical protein